MGDLVDLEINKNSGSGFIYLLLSGNLMESQTQVEMESSGLAKLRKRH